MPPFPLLGVIPSIFQHYPKTKKYISLFPPELRKGESQDVEVDAGREEVRAWIRTQMDSGELRAEPELHLDSKGITAEWGEEQRTPKKIAGLASSAMDVDHDAFFGEDS